MSAKELLSLSQSNKVEESIRETDQPLYLKSDDQNKLIQSIRKISIRSGMTFYVWVNNRGLVNLKSKEKELPQTKKIIDALKFANNNHYYAVYVFPIRFQNENDELVSILNSWPDMVQVNNETRFLFTFSSEIEMGRLENKMLQIKLKDTNLNIYKLRDAQWVLSND